MIRNRPLLMTCLVWVFICLAMSGVEGWVTASNITSWYVHLVKPPFNPPSWVFGPVWTVLYIMIGIAAGLLWHQRQQHPWLLIIFLLQLCFNFLWTFLFFGAKIMGWAFVDIALLWVTLLITIITAFFSHKKVAYLLLPYFLWVSFASYLNFSLWYLN